MKEQVVGADHARLQFRGRSAALMIALVVALVTPAVSLASQPGLLPDELARLSRGEILFKEELPPTDRALSANGGTAIALVEADIQSVWQILTDFNHYGGLFPRLKEAEVMEHDGVRTLVRYHVQAGPFSFRFFIAHVVSPEELAIRWRPDRSQENDLFRDTWGYWRLEPLDGNRVIVTYAMASRTVLPAFLTRGSEQEAVVKTVAALKARAERTRQVAWNSSMPPVVRSEAVER